MDQLVPQPVQGSLNDQNLSLPGNFVPTFQGREEQRARVYQLVVANGISEEKVKKEVEWFYTCLQIDDAYFSTFDPAAISTHVTILYGAKLVASFERDPYDLVIDLKEVSENSAFFIYSDEPGVTLREGQGEICEKRIDYQFLDSSTPNRAFRVRTYRQTVSPRLRCIFVAKCKFSVCPSLESQTKTDIKSVADSNFLSFATDINKLEVYQKILWIVESKIGLAMDEFEIEETKENCLVIGYKMGSTSSFFSNLKRLYQSYELRVTRQYVDHFSNGITIISPFFEQFPEPGMDDMVTLKIKKEISLLYCLRDIPFYFSGSHSFCQAAYAYCASIFAQYFSDHLGDAYLEVKNSVDETNPEHVKALYNLRRRLREETFTQEMIEKVIRAHPNLIAMLYDNFERAHRPITSMKLLGSVPFQGAQDANILKEIRRVVHMKHEQQVLESFLDFNRSILKTNFFKKSKQALSFRLDTDFMSAIEYPDKLFGIFMIIGNDFRGFHVRLQHVARGGVRLVESRDIEKYLFNLRTLFDENYALAVTQDLKNKDLPEGGAKGVILPTLDADPRRCFEIYMDAIFDLLTITPDSNEEGLVDYYGKPEILFFGPDEGTASMMDWAALHARRRGVKHWRSITTGKSAESFGGIPHDIYGMTTISIHQYTEGIYEENGLNEFEVTKVQTGGPDGDLGSNEILSSCDKTIAIIDGSGVLFDPEGINREELVHLATNRYPISKFNMKKLGPNGYLVKVTDQDINLPCGKHFQNGEKFRDEAHLLYKADIFVPCGGRPNSVNSDNVARLFDSDGVPNFKYIVEGANLFFTQEARLYLEERGVVVYKDSSTNKGGVTSSSFEVLLALALSDNEYERLMVHENKKPSEFYKNCVIDIKKKIKGNAVNERRCICREYLRLGGKKARSTISDELSLALNRQKARLEKSRLFDNVTVKWNAIQQAILETLFREIGLEKILKRLPNEYQRSIFASYMASHYVYGYGLDARDDDFFDFVTGVAEGIPTFPKIQNAEVYPGTR